MPRASKASETSTTLAPRRRSTRVIERSLQVNMRVIPHVFGMIIEEYVLMYREESVKKPSDRTKESVPIMPLLTSCKLAQELATPHLYKKVTFHTPKTYMSFLQHPPITSHIHVREVNFSLNKAVGKPKIELSLVKKINERLEKEEKAKGLDGVEVYVRGDIPVGAGGLLNCTTVTALGDCWFSWTPDAASEPLPIASLQLKQTGSFFDLWWMMEFRGGFRYPSIKHLDIHFPEQGDTAADHWLGRLRHGLRMAQKTRKRLTVKVAKTSFDMPHLPHVFCSRNASAEDTFTKEVNEQGVPLLFELRKACEGQCSEDITPAEETVRALFFEHNSFLTAQRGQPPYYYS